MIQDILRAFMFIFVAEMGDKTQILAMAFATKFSVKKVLIGIAIGAFINHGLAVLLGSVLSKSIPLNTIQMIAGFAFIGFAIWTLKYEDSENEEVKQKFGPVMTVSLAFFIGELGDKTQLTAITLSASAIYPFFILVGTTLGMVFTGAIGIFVGKKLGDKVPELGIKIIAFAIFMFFGLQKVFTTLDDRFLKVYYIIPFMLVLTLIAYFMIRKLFRMKKMGMQSDYQKKSKMLYEYYHHIKDDLDKICMGLEYCEKCLGDECVIGKSKRLTKEVLDNPNWSGEIEEPKENYPFKPFSKEAVIDSLADTVLLIDNLKDEKMLRIANVIRMQLEIILFKKVIVEVENINNYLINIKAIDEDIYNKINEIVSKSS